MRHAKKRKKILFGVIVLIVSLCVFVITILGISIDRIVYSSYQPEIEKNDMTRVPPDVIQKIRLTPPSKEFRVPILMYHYIENVKDLRDTIRISLSIPPEIFEAQVKTLSNAGYEFITTAELGRVLEGKASFPEKPVILTFDDGYEDFYTDVFPILKKYRAKSTAYIVSGRLDKSNYLSAKQLIEIARSDLVEIGAHTINHSSLIGDTLENVRKEVIGSKKQLEKITNTIVVSFAYPYGAFDDHTLRIVKESGFTNAVSTIPGINVSQQNKYFIFRIRPGQKTDKDLIEYLDQSYFNPW